MLTLRVVPATFTEDKSHEYRFKRYEETAAMDYGVHWANEESNKIYMRFLRRAQGEIIRL